MKSIEIQFFEGCPNVEEMISRVKEAISNCGIEVEYIESIVDTPEKAQITVFRGSPTLLIEGEDFEAMPVPDAPRLACRTYPEGLPTVSQIIQRLQ